MFDIIKELKTIIETTNQCSRMALKTKDKPAAEKPAPNPHPDPDKEENNDDK